MTKPWHSGRRQAIRAATFSVALLPMTALARPLTPTPAVTVGPFYPPHPAGLPFFPARALRPLPEGNDLTLGAGGRRAEGDRIAIGGRILASSGGSVAGARVEIWQVDARGHYAVETAADRDPGFAGYGTVVTGNDGAYAFRTVRPRGYGRYGGLIKRAAHIHLQVTAPGRKPFATEIWFDGDPWNARDTFVTRIGAPELRERMLVKLVPLAGGLPTGVFDVVLPEP